MNLMVFLAVIFSLLVGYIAGIVVQQRKFKKTAPVADLVIADVKGEPTQVFLQGDKTLMDKKSGDLVYVEIVRIKG